jgi:hypothetical protein
LTVAQWPYRRCIGARIKRLGFAGGEESVSMRTGLGRWIFGLVAGTSCLCAAFAPAGAVTTFQKSAYTAVDRKACTTLRTHSDGNAHLCHGLDGYPIYLAEGDGRTFVAASTQPETSKAALQTLKAFNTPFAHPQDRATVEWRFVIRENRKVPFAMIVRYFTEKDGRKGEVLVVSRISGAEACHVAYVDALANANAIVLARRIADERARTFDCGSGTASAVGDTGRSPL